MRALFVAWLALSLFIAQSVGVWAQSAPAYNGRVNNAIAGIVSQKAAQEGFAANDNRIGATENAIGAGIGGFATTVVGGAVAGIVTGTAIAWLPLLAIAAAVGVTAVVITAGYQWVFSGNTSADGTVVTQVTPQGSSVPSTTALVQGQTAWKVTDGSVACWGGTPDLATTCYNGEMNTVGGFPSGQDIFDTTGPCVISGTTATCPDKRGAPNVLAFNLSGNQFTSPISCSGGMAMAQGGTTYKTSWTLQCYTGSGGSSPSGPESVEAATASVPASVLASPVDPGLLTNIINQRWQAAASQPGYQGLPYQASNPVTATDVATWQALNPNAYPTVQDVLAPISPSAATGTVGTVSVPDASVSGSTAPATNAGTNPGTGNQVNLGPDPGIGSPSLENTPTMTQILAPLVGVFPGLRSFVMPSHTSTCPTPTFEAFGQTYTIQAHCTILSQNAATIQTAMIAFWTLAALLIILAA